MIGVIFVGILDGKVIHDEGECNRPCMMFPETSGEVGGSISKGGKEFLQAIIGKLASLGEAIHTLANFDIDIAVVN